MIYISQWLKFVGVNLLSNSAMQISFRQGYDTGWITGTFTDC